MLLIYISVNNISRAVHYAQPLQDALVVHVHKDAATHVCSYTLKFANGHTIASIFPRHRLLCLTCKIRWAVCAPTQACAQRFSSDTTRPSGDKGQNLNPNLT